LKTIGVEPESIDACLVTHEHSDHVKGVGAAAKRWGWQVFATSGTARAPQLAETKVKKFSPGAVLEFPRMVVSTTATPHDANQSVGFVVESRSTGARAGLFYDIGHASASIADACTDLDILVLESNHDDAMLRNGPYPRWLQARIASPTGHLSNADSSAFARRAVTRATRHLVLAHLSENCNMPRLALAAMRAAVAGSRFRGTLTAARQDAPVGPFCPSAARAEPPMQFQLF
jgi:phosphoribosyl 1,2-cyclic phosphodiesterase